MASNAPSESLQPSSVWGENSDVHQPVEDAVDPRFVVHSRAPLNAELPPQFQDGVITPNDLFFHRNRFNRPVISAADWRLQVDGEVVRPFSLGYDELLSLPSRTLTVTLECAGNGRSRFQPVADGEPWGHGAVGTAEWTGVPLSVVLEAAGLTPRALEILARGVDGGRVEGRDEEIPFARSLPLEKALHPDTLIAYVMNGERLPAAHGFPARLIVPGWYGVASVKWLSHITALAEPFSGYFQSERYIVPAEDGQGTVPVTRLAPRSVIVSPAPGATVAPGPLKIRGLAWSGYGAVELVEGSADGGHTWKPADWTSDHQPYAWRAWELWWDLEPGDYELRSRVTDVAGNTQPDKARWNRLGYVNNAIQPVPIHCAGGRS